MNVSLSSTDTQPDVVRLLAPVRRAIGVRRIARGALLGFAAGAVLSAIGLVAASLLAMHVTRFAALVPCC